MLRLILLLGLISFFADMTYEGARSITGPFFALLGASGAIVGVLAGLAEFIGYGIHFVSGMIADRSKNYWLLTAIGYTANLVVVPLFALVGSWHMAAFLLILERVGKAFRTPSRDAMLSYACNRIGRGWGFGLHEALDRCGGLLGPLLIFAILSKGPHLKMAFALLAIPAAFALVTLYVTYRRFPHPETAESSQTSFSLKNFPRSFWIFVSAAALMGAGTLDFALVSYHLQKHELTPTSHTPLFYMGAIAVSALFALTGGKWFDKSPKIALYFGMLLGSITPLLLFLGNKTEIWIRIACWGIALGTQNSLFRSALATLIPPEKRSTGYGIFGALFGLAWFLGSALIGTLYDLTIAISGCTSLLLQLLAIPLLRKVKL